MSTINIAKNYRQYSPEELREYALKGLLECNGFDLSDFVERIFSDYKVETDQDDVDTIISLFFDRVWSEARSAAISAVENI